MHMWLLNAVQMQQVQLCMISMMRADEFYMCMLSTLCRIIQNFSLTSEQVAHKSYLSCVGILMVIYVCLFE